MESDGYDPGAIQQVFRNLIENALNAAFEPVIIDVKWREIELDERPALEMRLRNNGAPLDPEEQRRIFEPFFTTKTRGAGLGMTIVKRIVDEHAGSIELSADIPTGAEFVIKLPRTRPGPAAAVSESSS